MKDAHPGNGEITVPSIRTILVPTDFSPPAAEAFRQAHALARALLHRGARVTALSEGGGPAQADGAHEGVPVRRVAARGGPLGRAAGLVRAMVALRGSYDVVHLHNLSWFAVPVIVAAHALGRPVLSKLPSSGMLGGLPRQASRRFGRLWLRVFLTSDAVAALSDESVAEVRALGYPAERVFQVCNGVSLQRFHPPAAPRDPGAPLRFVYLGRLSPEKGVEDLVEAWPRVAAEAGRPVRLALHGQGPLREPLRARAAALGPTVEVLDLVDDVAAVLRESDVLVLPSHVEGISNALLEAMATGLAVVATAVGGTPFVVGPAGARWLVPAGDPAALAARMAALARDDAARAALGAALLRRAREHFDVEVVAAAYLRVYGQLARGERGVAPLSLARPAVAPEPREAAPAHV